MRQTLDCYTPRLSFGFGSHDWIHVDKTQLMKCLVQTACILLVIASFTGCLQWQSSAQADSKQPEKVLYDNAMDAAEHGKFDVAGLTLQTLINTYPDSEYAVKAKEAMQDPRFAAYKNPWGIPGGGMTFFAK